MLLATRQVSQAEALCDRILAAGRAAARASGQSLGRSAGGVGSGAGWAQPGDPLDSSWSNDWPARGSPLSIEDNMLAEQIIPALAFAALIAAQFVAAIAIHMDADDFYSETARR